MTRQERETRATSRDTWWRHAVEHKESHVRDRERERAHGLVGDVAHGATEEHGAHHHGRVADDGVDAHLVRVVLEEVEHVAATARRRVEEAREGGVVRHLQREHGEQLPRRRAAAGRDAQAHVRHEGDDDHVHENGADAKLVVPTTQLRAREHDVVRVEPQEDDVGHEGGEDGAREVDGGCAHDVRQRRTCTHRHRVFMRIWIKKWRRRSHGVTKCNNQSNY